MSFLSSNGTWLVCGLPVQLISPVFVSFLPGFKTIVTLTSFPSEAFLVIITFGGII
ncbi:hypothetical protein [Mycoplasma marinum]|uniref:hypothetical protein n=1 Tax=Mycoplasma marinum TaxID=1937190 RepID=UPI001443DB64|nr:hypothetical protein [Mycoplasma marinum]